MAVHTLIVIILSIIWSVAEGLLLVKDKRNAKGSTKADKKTRFLNFLFTECALLSALFILYPATNYDSQSISAFTVTGALLAVLGFALRHISIHILGEYFRTTVEIGKDQPVVQSGPYRMIRHPSYSGIILFFIGYGILSQNWICLIACIVLPAAALSYRIRVEEQALIDELGMKYQDYMAKTKKLIPFIW